jgi:hypothetical protein
VALFRRRKPLHQQLAEAGGLSIDDGAHLVPAPEPAPERLPGWHGGSPLAEPALHGIPRPRAWDAVATAYSPGLVGDRVQFVALPDGTLVAEQEGSREALAPLAEAVGTTLGAPYRAEAVRKDDALWAVSAARIVLAELPDVTGDELELALAAGHHQLLVDGEPTHHAVRELERLGERSGPDYVVRGRRIDGELWEVEATPL